MDAGGRTARAQGEYLLARPGEVQHSDIMAISGSAFVPGIELSRIMYEEEVQPILRNAFPGLRYAAARVGSGSEVLGFDSPRSADHEWGPRLEIFLTAGDRVEHGDDISRVLAERLPKQVRGWPTHFQESDDPRDPVGHMQMTDGPVNHRVGLYDVDGWVSDRLGLASWKAELGARDWLAIPQQRLAEATGGVVFHDGPGNLSEMRRRMAWYPDQVWRYLLACQWQRVSQEEAFVGRCAEAGDDLGSAVVAARLVRSLMHLCLLLERQYAPYGKWLGSSFGRLPVAEALGPVLRGVLAATDYPAREARLCDAYEAVASLQNASDLVSPVDPGRRPYHARPYLVLHAERFAQALARTVTDPGLQGLPLVGNVDQWSDSADLLDQPHAIRAAFSALG